MRSFSCLLLLLTLPQLDVARAIGEDRERLDLVALDRSSADLLRRIHPKTEFPVLVGDGDETYRSLNARAWSMRDADCLVFRSDQLSVTSQMFRERLKSQGVRSVDLSPYLAGRRALSALYVDSQSLTPLRPLVRGTVVVADPQDQPAAGRPNPYAASR